MSKRLLEHIMTTVLVGYARTSTSEQEAGLEAQLRDLTAVGCRKVFFEKVSSVAVREELARAMEYLREGDALVVTKLDRLARSMRDLVSIVERLEEKGVALRILAMSLDTATPTGRLMLNVLGSVAQFEREMMLERQREGIAKARSAGMYKGRKPTARARSAEVLQLAGAGVGPVEISRRLGIGRTSVHRILSGAKAHP